MESRYILRKAILSDINFLSEAIINAEKSNSNRLSLSTFFDLEEEKVVELIVQMLDEEIEGCEFSIDSFMVVTYNDLPVAAVAGWIEKVTAKMASSLLKSNLIGFVFPLESIKYVKEKSELITDLIIERKEASLQIEYVYVQKEHRGNRLAQRLIDEHIKRAKEVFPAISIAQVQLFSNNQGAKKVYERLGFTLSNVYKSKSADILEYLPHGEKILMEKLF